MLRCSTLWNSNAIKAEARERVAWHEQMALSGEVTEKQQVQCGSTMHQKGHLMLHATCQSQSTFLVTVAEKEEDNSRMGRTAVHTLCSMSQKCTNKTRQRTLQERRLMEYMALGDYQTAVGFLLAAPPERSARYYRDALCTLALAAAAVTGDTAGSSDGGGRASAAAATESASRTLLVQAAKVVTANAASVGDTLLGVPLLCAAGVPQPPIVLRRRIACPLPRAH